jgi:hypothetical protein
MIPALGTVTHYSASGNLKMHGVTMAVNFTVSAERIWDAIDVLADIPIVFAAWNITNPSIGGFVVTQSSGTLGVLLHLTPGAGNPGSSGTSGPAGSGGAITVPSTTVPPLTVPSD